MLKARDEADGIRFLREAKVAAGLSHRNIVQVFDYWDGEDGPVFLVMELLVGEALGAVLERGALPVEEAVALLSRPSQAPSLQRTRSGWSTAISSPTTSFSLAPAEAIMWT